MQILNPNTPLRTGYVTALANIGIPVYAKKLPKNITPIPLHYCLLTSQTINRTAVGKNCFEWLCSIVVDVIFNGPSGYANPIQNDTIEGKIVQAIETNLIIPNWIVKNTIFVQSQDLDIETTTQSIERRIITYQHWLWPSTT